MTTRSSEEQPTGSGEGASEPLPRTEFHIGAPGAGRTLAWSLRDRFAGLSAALALHRALLNRPLAMVVFSCSP